MPVYNQYSNDGIGRVRISSPHPGYDRNRRTSPAILQPGGGPDKAVADAIPSFLREPKPELGPLSIVQERLRRPTRENTEEEAKDSSSASSSDLGEVVVIEHHDKKSPPPPNEEARLKQEREDTRRQLVERAKLERRLGDIRRQLKQLDSAPFPMSKREDKRHKRLGRRKVEIDKLHHSIVAAEAKDPLLFRQVRQDLEMEAGELYDAARSAASADFHAVYNDSHARDTTIHVELEVTEDFDEELEEFSRLVRIGNFRVARSFFDEHLCCFADNPNVFVQYAEMLLAQGDYKSIQSLDDSRAFPSAARNSEDAEASQRSHLRSLWHNWRLIEASSLIFTQHETGPISNKLPQTLFSFPKSKDIGSTEIRIIALEISISLHKAGEGLFADPEDWSSLYGLLRDRDRVWDFRDIFIAACDYLGPLQAGRLVFGPADALKCILDDWTSSEPDESTLLALLDIFTAMALKSTNVISRVQSFTKHCLEYADKVGNCLLQAFPETLKSRPVLFWTITKSAISLRTHMVDKNDDNAMNSGYFDGYVGISRVRWDKNCIGLPHYIPINQENPGWRPPHLPHKSSQVLERAFDAAKGNDDFKVQAHCLQELAVRTQKPAEMLEELATLQKDTQLDMHGYLLTCLAKYLVYTDDESKEKLRWSDSAAREVIQQALSPSMREGRAPSIKAALRYYHHLDKAFRRGIDRYVPRSTDGRDLRDIQPRIRDGESHADRTNGKEKRHETVLGRARAIQDGKITDKPRGMSMREKLALDDFQTSPRLRGYRDDIGARRETRPVLAIEAPPLKQPDLGSTVEDVPDDDRQEQQNDVPDYADAFGPSIRASPVDEKPAQARALDSASQVPGERWASSPPVENLDVPIESPLAYESDEDTPEAEESLEAKGKSANASRPGQLWRRRRSDLEDSHHNVRKPSLWERRPRDGARRE